MVDERRVKLPVKYAPVTLKVPSNKEGEPISLYYVGCKELNHDKPLCWHILTSEPILNAKDAEQILDYYEKRWLKDRNIEHISGAPYHPVTQGEIERYRESLDNITLVGLSEDRRNATLNRQPRVRPGLCRNENYTTRD